VNFWQLFRETGEDGVNANCVLESGLAVQAPLGPQLVQLRTSNSLMCGESVTDCG